eukprot:jgi/Bigna1/138576/aug1.45_g13284
MGASESGLAQKLFSVLVVFDDVFIKEFDANKNDVLETRELDKFFSELTAADVSEEVISAMKKQAKEPDFTVPTDLAGLLQMARLTGQQKELEEKKYDFEKLLEITDFESFEKESGLKVGHVARLKRAIVKIKIAKDDAKTGLDKDSNGFVSKDEFVTFLKTIKISEDDSKKFQE